MPPSVASTGSSKVSTISVGGSDSRACGAGVLDTRAACAAAGAAEPSTTATTARSVDHEGAPERQPPGHGIAVAHGNSLPVRRPRRSVGAAASATRASVRHRVGEAPSSIRRPRGSGVLVGHAGLVERRHLAQDPRRRLEHGERQARPGALAEPKAQVEHGFEAEVLERR